MRPFVSCFYFTTARKNWLLTAGLMVLVNISVEPVTIFVWMGVQTFKSVELKITTVSSADRPDKVVCNIPPLTVKPPKTGCDGCMDLMKSKSTCNVPLGRIEVDMAMV